MSNLNLYSYYDKSLADINKDYLNAKNAKKEKKQSKGKGKKLALIVFLSVALATVAGIILGKQLSKTALESVQTEAPAKPDLRSREEKLGYVKVQIFEFTDEAANTESYAKPVSEAVVPVEDKAKEDPIEKNEDKKPIQPAEQSKPVEDIAPAPKNKTPQKASAVATNQKATEKTVKKYSIVFENINTGEYNTVNSLAAKYKLVPEIKNYVNNPVSFWRVYRIEPTSKTVIGGKNVEKVQDFTDKNAAVAYAKEHNIQSVIRFEEEDNKIYTIKLCCTSLESAKKMAESSNIRNKTIKIIREK